MRYEDVELGDDYARLGRLLTALKQHRRQTRNLWTALAALRQMQSGQ